MKTIIMRDPIPEAKGSRFPLVQISASEAEARCRAMGGRLPTSEEYARLFAVDPWPHLVYEWTSTSTYSGGRVVRGGAWVYWPSLARASDRDGVEPAFRIDFVGFRCARDIADDAEVPEGWVVI